MVHRVVLAKDVQRQLPWLPRNIRRKLIAWALLVEDEGLRRARTITGYHDEPLHGSRAGQRSIRLSRSYRAFYITTDDGQIEVVSVIEVNKHDY